jgi:ABC-type oligopeptide transport system substrate-binding subunit
MRPTVFPLVAGLVFGLVVGLVSCRGGEGPSVKARELTLSVSFELTSLDPHLHNRLASYSVLQHAYEALVAADREMTIRPALAVRWENPTSSRGSSTCGAMPCSTTEPR